MTTRRARLARLLAIRTVQMRRAAQTFSNAAAVAAAADATAGRLRDLRTEFRVNAGCAAGYAVKAAAATREALVAAESRQGLRWTEAEARRVAAAGQFQHRRAAVDTTVRAIERDVAGASDRSEPA